MFFMPGPVIHFVFLPAASRPVESLALCDRLLEDVHWQASPIYIPRERPSNKWLAIRSHVTRLPIYKGDQISELLPIVASSFHCHTDELAFGFPEQDSPLHDLVERRKPAQRCPGC